MACKSCPHHVRHGVAASDGVSIEFKDRCGLAMKNEKDLSCEHYPFPKNFDYYTCEIYVDVFKSSGVKNSVVSTTSIEYTTSSSAGSITDMDYL